MKHWSKKSGVWNNWKIKLFDSYHYDKGGEAYAGMDFIMLIESS